MHPDQTAAVALLATIDSSDWPRLISGARQAVAACLSAGSPPSGLVRLVLAGDDAELLRALAGNPLARFDPAARERFATTAGLSIAWDTMAKGRHWTYRDWERLLARHDPATPDGRARLEGGGARDIPHGLPTVLALSPIRSHNEVALRLSADRLTTREQVRTLVNAQRHSGDGEVAAVIGRFDLSAGTRALKALAGEGLEALAAELDRTETAIAELRSAPDERAEAHARERADLDWSLIAGAHAAEPFGAAAAASLCARDDCPADLRTALFTAHPAAVAETFPSPPVELFSLPLKGSGRAKALRTLTGRFLDDGRIAELVEHARPASAVLESARRADSLEPTVWRLRPVHAVLGRVLAATVRSDVGAWRTLRRLLKAHKGTVGQLCEMAAAAPDDHGPWPEAEALPALDVKSGFTGARKAFVVLLDAAGAETQLALLPHLDERTAADLFVHGVWRREWFGHVMENGSPGLRLAFARTRGTLAVEQVQRMLDLGDPDLTAAIALRRPMTAAQIAHVMSGRAFAGHTADGEVFPAELRARFLATTGGWHARHAITCADPVVQRHILRHVRVRGKVPQLRLLLDVWERHGRDTMLSLVDEDLEPLKYTSAEFQLGVVERVRETAAAEDEEAEKERLRAYLAERETPAWQIARLRDPDFSTHESHDWFWPEIAAAHAEKPIYYVEGVRSAPGGEALEPPPDRPELAALESGATCAAAFPDISRTDFSYTRDWMLRAIDAGLVDWAELFAHGRPAAHILAAAGADGADRWLPGLREAIGGRELTSEALLMALRMLPDFAGTVPELLATAAEVTGEGE
ncbi:hypothetical protein AB0I28_38385 [Phytomonospora sp. NPDC050363]|uniref:hypothetical protein n=1 Tax=Phytomonospora sp. NPDC050363 TaxID=3155642 RepID=UPI0033F24690